MALLAAAGLAALPTAVAAHNCTCRSGGVNYPQGALVCIRGKLARCEMFLNNSSWKVVAEACPETSLILPPRQHGWQSLLMTQSGHASCRANDAGGASS
jgi:hypothetical protein